MVPGILPRAGFVHTDPLVWRDTSLAICPHLRSASSHHFPSFPPADGAGQLLMYIESSNRYIDTGRNNNRCLCVLRNRGRAFLVDGRGSDCGAYLHFLRDYLQDSTESIFRSRSQKSRTEVCERSITLRSKFSEFLEVNPTRRKWDSPSGLSILIYRASNMFPCRAFDTLMAPSTSLMNAVELKAVVGSIS